MSLSVATCYFPVAADIRRNARYVLRQMRVASKLGADVAHFPEACLSGYAGADFPSYGRFDWSLLLACTQDVLAMARELRLWVVIGSTHPLTGQHKPHDSVYVVNDHGRLVNRYDKMFGSADDLVHYSPGDHFVTFALRGVRCGVLISTVDTNQRLYDGTAAWRDRAMRGVFHSGAVVRDRRSQARRRL